MPDTADNLLRNGFAGVEGLGRGEKNHDVRYPELVVNDARSDEYDSFTLRVFGAPQLVADNDRSRTSLKIRNLSGGNVVVGKMSKVTNGTGYLLTPGSDLSVKTTSSVWVGPETPNSSTMVMCSVWTERAAE